MRKQKTKVSKRESTVISIRVRADVSAKIARLRGTRSISEVVRDAVLAYSPQKSSALDRISHLIGAFDGPSDASTNKKFLRGYGE